MENNKDCVEPTLETIGRTFTWVKYAFKLQKPLLKHLHLKLDNETQLMDYPHERIRIKFAVKRNVSKVDTFDFDLEFSDYDGSQLLSTDTFIIKATACVRDSESSPATISTLLLFTRVLEPEKSYRITQGNFNLTGDTVDWIIYELDFSIVRCIKNKDCVIDNYIIKGTIIHDMRQGLYSDLIIKVGNESFLAHKQILSLQSPTFKAMFFNEDLDKEYDDSIICIDDFEPRTIKELLNFVYTGHVSNCGEVATKLLLAAHKYQVQELLTACDTHMIKGMTCNNVDEVLQIAKNCDRPLLRQYADAYVRENEEKVVKTQRYQKFLRRDLSKDTVVRTLELCMKYGLNEIKSDAFDCLKANKDSLVDKDFLKRFRCNPEFVEEMVLALL